MGRSILLIIVVTICVGLVSAVIQSPSYFSQPGAFSIMVLVLGVLYALPNLVILVVLHYLKVLRSAVTSMVFILFEVIILYTCVWAVDKLLDLVPREDYYEVTATLTTVKPLYSETAQHIYAFALTVIIIIPIARMLKWTA